MVATPAVTSRVIVSWPMGDRLAVGRCATPHSATRAGALARTPGACYSRIMARRAAWLVAILVVAGLLVVAGVVTVRIDIHPPGRAPAQEFWRTATGDGALP